MVLVATSGLATFKLRPWSMKLPPYRCLYPLFLIFQATFICDILAGHLLKRPEVYKKKKFSKVFDKVCTLQTVFSCVFKAVFGSRLQLLAQVNESFRLF